MELPHIGDNCHEKTCKQLDFLPMKCDACSNIFCKNHIHYSTHSCTESYKKDNQVPVCPLCNTPIPVRKGVSVDVVIGQHIDNDCQSDPAKSRRKVYTNKCSHKGCKTKELVPVLCDKCQKNYCLKHRFEQDHDCHGFEGSGRSGTRTGAAALDRLQKNKTNTSSGPSKPQQTTLSNIGRDLNRERRERQGQTSASGQIPAGMSEDEALARAIQMSLAESSQSQQTQQPTKSLTREEQEDLQLAQALAASEEEARRQRTRQRQSQTENKSSCMVS